MILASGSPQRRAILEQLGVAFTVMVPGVDELTAGDPAEVVRENARRKASAVGAAAVTILGVDTVVELNGRIFGKPTDREHAAATLRELSGRTHHVLSGVCVIEEGGRWRDAVAETTVRFRPISESAIDWYLDTGEWRERAGGYAIQGRGAALVEGIEGDYLNVVGLPVATLLALLPSLLFPAVF